MHHRMSRFAILPALALLGAALLWVSGCKQETGDQGAGAARAVNWKMASSFPATLPLLGTGGPYFSERIKTISRGRVQITFFDPGKLVPALEVFDAVSKGSVDAGWAAPGWRSSTPAGGCSLTGPPEQAASIVPRTRVRQAIRAVRICFLQFIERTVPKPVPVHLLQIS